MNSNELVVDNETLSSTQNSCGLNCDNNETSIEPQQQQQSLEHNHLVQNDLDDDVGRDDDYQKSTTIAQQHHIKTAPLQRQPNLSQSHFQQQHLETDPLETNEFVSLDDSPIINNINDDDDDHDDDTSNLIDNCKTVDNVVDDEIEIGKQQQNVKSKPSHVDLIDEFHHHHQTFNNESFESTLTTQFESLNLAAEARGSITSRSSSRRKSRIVIRKFQKLDQSVLSSAPAPDVKIGQRVAYKEYYGNEFGTIRWIGRVPQICPDWTVGVEFDNAIGEGDGSLNGRRYFIAKDCFAKFLSLNSVALVDQHVGRPEPGTMISVMSTSVRPGQMISIQRVSTVHVQHCFLNAPHRRIGADILAVNTRLHCQCPSCGPCAHVIKPPRTQRLPYGTKNATHMCQFSTYTCCGMESQEETMCTYTGNKVLSSPPPPLASSAGLPPVGNSWIEGAGYLSNLQAQQSKLMPEEYRLGAAPEDIGNTRRSSLSRRSSSRHGSGKHHHHNRHQQQHHRHHKRIKKQDTTSTNEFGAPASPAGQMMDLIDYNNNNNNVDNSNMDLKPYSPSPTTFSQTPDLAVANLEKQNSYEPQSNENNWPDESINKIMQNNRSKIVYRDSIENRYLFPTDDPIDSTLEADLENLSQARYGHCGHNSRLNGTVGGGSSRNLFKSLRSLVSCLSANNNESEFGDRHSTNDDRTMINTLKYSEQHHGLANETGNNKSIPPIETINRPPSSFDFSQQHPRQQQSMQFNRNNCDPIDENDDFYSSSRSPSSEGKKKSFYDYHHQQQASIMTTRVDGKCHNVYSSSDCGFSSASQNSINFQSLNQATFSPKLTNADNQIYQRIISRLINTTSLSNEDLVKLKDVLFEQSQHHFDSCCLHNNNNTKSALNNQTDIDQIIADVIKNSFLKNQEQVLPTTITTSCNHMTTTTNSSYCKGNLNNNGYAYGSDNGSKMMEDNCAHNSSNKKSVHESLPECCSKFDLKSLTNGSSASEAATLSSYDSLSCNAAINDNNRTTENEKRRNEKIKIDGKSVDGNAGLPKAFELKLTLSINSEKKSTGSGNETGSSFNITTRPTSSDDQQLGGTNLLNSTLDINIVSQSGENGNNLKNEDGTENVSTTSETIAQDANYEDENNHKEVEETNNMTNDEA